MNASSTLFFTIPGWYLLRHRPELIFGWLALLAGIGHGLGGLGFELAVAGQLGTWQIPAPTVWLWLAAWGPLVEQPVLMAVYGMFPDGRWPHRRLRPAIAASLLLACAGVLLVALDAFPARGAVDARLRGVRNPFSIGAANSEFLPLFFAPAAVIVVVTLVIRWRRAVDDERRVLWWIVAIGVPLTIVVPVSVVAFPQGGGALVAQSSTLLEVAVIVTATLRHRVHGIEIVLDRTLLYGALTAMVALIYGAVVGVTGFFGAEGNGAPSIIGAAVAAFVFSPTRVVLQRGIDHFVYGNRDDPYAVLSTLTAGLGATGSSDETLSAFVAATAATLRLPYVAVELPAETGVRSIAHGSAPSAVTRLPLRYANRPVGVLVFGHRSGEAEASPAEMQLLVAVAHQVSIAVANALLTDDLRRSRERIVSAREEERLRLRMDLHDGLGPQLTAVALGLDAAADRAPLASDATTLERLRDEVHDAINDVRRLVQGLRPPRLDEVGLLAALRELADRASRGGVHVNVWSTGPIGPLPTATEVALYRIVAEALNNVARHSAATSCTVEIRADTAAVEAIIADDGHTKPTYGDGLGMASMRDRAEELGGWCRSGSFEPHGWKVHAYLPLVTQ